MKDDFYTFFRPAAVSFRHIDIEKRRYGYRDPAQFVISTEPTFSGFQSTRTAAAELGERLVSQLRGLGFDVRRESVVCGAAVIHDRTYELLPQGKSSPWHHIVCMSCEVPVTPI